MKFVALLIFLSSCAHLSQAELDCRRRVRPWAGATKAEADYNSRAMCADAVDRAVAKARAARANGERWCEKRGEGFEVCRNPTPADFYEEPQPSMSQKD